MTSLKSRYASTAPSGNSELQKSANRTAKPPIRREPLSQQGCVNWDTNGTGTSPNGYTCNMPRLAARHGQLTVNKCNAYTNFAFFDGHVQLFATQPIEDNVNNGKVGNVGMYTASGTVFILANQ